jgi:cation diffusion facilitator CzcD-associated flavoprotein CzcO
MTSSSLEQAVIVGAGLAGLTAAYHLKERGIDALLLDRDSTFGSSWNARHPQLTLNTHRSVSNLPKLKYPDRTPAFPRRDDVIRHLDAFALRHSFRVSFNAEVTSIEQSVGCFQLNVGDTPIRATNVIFATGRDRECTSATIQGSETFGGECRHAAAFGDANDYSGKRVLVIGGGNSGFDVVNHLSRIATAQVWFSVRSGSAILPKRLKGVAIHRFSPLMEAMPSSVSDLAINFAQRLAFGDIHKLGLPVPSVGAATRLRRDQVAIPIDDGAIRSIREGRTKVVGEALSIDGPKVFFADGGMAEPDVIIMATGYSSGLARMLSHLDVLDGQGNPPTGSNAIRSRVPGLWFIGMTPGLVSYFRNADREAKGLAREIARRPSEPATGKDRSQGCLEGVSTIGPTQT